MLDLSNLNGRRILFTSACLLWYLLFSANNLNPKFSAKKIPERGNPEYLESQNVYESREKGWQPVEYITVANEDLLKFPELKQISSNFIKFPLLSLSKGNIPAILVHDVLSTRQISYLLRDIEKLPKLGYSDLKMALKISRTKLDFARVLHSASISEKEILEQYSQYRSIIDRIQGTVASLAGKEGKTLITPKRYSGYKIASTGFRVQGNGTGFPTHFDSLQANQWESKRRCGEKKKKKQRSSFVETLPHFTYENLLSMVAMLSTENGVNNTDNAVRLYKCGFKTLQGTCSVRGRSHEIGANLLGFSKWAEERKIPTYDVKLKEGDMYIFNANFVHEIIKSKNRGKRMTIASFLSYDEKKNDILPWI